MIIATTIKNLRKKANLTQANFADALGVHFQTVSKWERGTSIPDISMLGDIAKVLGVSIEAVLSVEESPTPIVGTFDMKSLAKAITEYRKYFGFSQVELAEKVGVSADSVSKWEREVISPDMDVLVKLSQVFGISQSTLYYGITKDEKPQKKIFYGKRKTKWAIAIASGLAVIMAVLAVVFFLPKQMEYTVTIDGVSSYAVKSGEYFTPQLPEKKGYEVVAFTNKDGQEITFPYKITGDEEFFVEYKPIDYAINLWANGGIIEGEVKTCINIEEEKFTLPIPQKDGDEFEGWYLSPDYEGEPTLQIECEFKDLTLYAKWKNTVYTVKYFLDGGVCEENPQTVDKNTEFTLNEPIKKGYIFLGWYDTKDGGKKYQSVGGKNAKNLILYALWQKEEVIYNITYDLNGGTLDGINPTQIASGETYKLLEPTKLGYEFLGWNDNPNGLGETHTWLNGDRDLTLYAIFSAKEYVIRYEYKGVYVDKSNPSFIEFGQEVKLNPVVFEGYTFMGWYDSKDGGNKIDVIDETNVYTLSVLYARYQPKTFNISLDGANGNFSINGATHKQYTLSYLYDTKVELPNCTREKYTFLGWLGSDGKTYTQIDSKSYHATPFVAQWTLTDGFEIKYVLNGGTHVGNFPVNAFSGQNKLLASAKKEGFIFLGWNDKADGSGNYYTYTPDTEKETFTLYAIWQEIITNGSIASFNYVKSSTQVTITEYKGEIGENVNVVVPSYIDGLPVTKLATEFIFKKNSKLKSLKLPTTLVELEENAIVIKEILEPLIIPKTVESLGEACLEGVFASIKFEEGSRLKSLQQLALVYTTIKDVLELPEGMEELEPECVPEHAIGMILPKSLKKISAYAFRSDYFSTSDDDRIYIPSGVEEIGLNALSGYRCIEGLDEHTITIKDGDKTVTTLTGCVFNLPVIEKEGYDFVGWKNSSGEFVSKYFINEENKDITLTLVYERNDLPNGYDQTRPLVITANDNGKRIALSTMRTNYFVFDDCGEEIYRLMIVKKDGKVLKSITFSSDGGVDDNQIYSINFSIYYEMPPVIEGLVYITKV